MFLIFVLYVITVKESHRKFEKAGGMKEMKSVAKKDWDYGFKGTKEYLTYDLYVSGKTHIRQLIELIKRLWYKT
jgi:predicted urease superfamily metal-dependent hydrolase